MSRTGVDDKKDGWNPFVDIFFPPRSVYSNKLTLTSDEQDKLMKEWIENTKKLLLKTTPTTMNTFTTTTPFINIDKKPTKKKIYRNFIIRKEE